MDVRVRGDVNPGPFLSARDIFETEFDLERPVQVCIRDDPDERTWAAHYEDHHVLNVSRRIASSAMARELSLHEFAHMYRYEEGHASHHQSTKEALYLALTGPGREDELTYHGLQIANHMKDIYADDLTLSVGPSEKLVSFLESSLATAIGRGGPDGPAAGITAINAAFALALCERHGLLEENHRLYDLAAVAGEDAPYVPLDQFKSRFRSLASDPTTGEYRRELVGSIRSYARFVRQSDGLQQ